jgi:hypothetical protein
MRVWKYNERLPRPQTTAGISPRGLHLMLVEFLVRHPGKTCVVSSPPPGLAALAGLFPGTLFHVYRLYNAEDESVGNVVHHPCELDKAAAEGWSIRPGSCSLVLLGEGMDRQVTLCIAAAPRVSMMLITEPPEHYVGGELVFPIWCSRDSHLCALVVAGGQTKGYHYGAAQYEQGMREFQTGHRDAAYDTGMEDMILGMYAGTQCDDPGAIALLSEIVRMGLPPKGEQDLRFPLSV